MSPTIAERSHTFEPEGRKRVPKACDRCRLKKVKCDGNMPCPRCRMEDAVCHFGARRKSAERPIAPGYVDQLETQQKILIKALKKTWKTYAPAETRNRIGDEPSIHEIVKNLGALDDASANRSISPEFHFNEALNASSPTIKTEANLSSSSHERGSSQSSESSYALSPGRINNPFTGGLTNPSSPSHSNASSYTSIDSTSNIDQPLLNTEGISSEPKMPFPPTNSSPKSKKPTFCPLPSRPYIAPPIKPFRMEWTGSDLYPSAQGLDESIWMTTDANWNDGEFGAQAAALNLSRGPEGLPQMLDDTWNSWIDDHVEDIKRVPF